MQYFELVSISLENVFYSIGWANYLRLVK